jgi:hypothetical protein
MEQPFKTLSVPPGFKTIGRFEKDFALAFQAVQDGVHVITGDLKSSGVPRTHYDGDTWEGEIEYDEDPGIFELARGDEATANHPEGGHGFFDRVEPFIQKFHADVNAFFEDAFDKGPI